MMFNNNATLAAGNSDILEKLDLPPPQPETTNKK